MEYRRNLKLKNDDKIIGKCAGLLSQYVSCLIVIFAVLVLHITLISILPALSTYCVLTDDGVQYFE